MNKSSSLVTESVDDLYSDVTDIIANYQELKQTDRDYYEMFCTSPGNSG